MCYMPVFKNANPNANHSNFAGISHIFFQIVKPLDRIVKKEKELKLSTEGQEK